MLAVTGLRSPFPLQQPEAFAVRIASSAALYPTYGKTLDTARTFLRLGAPRISRLSLCGIFGKVSGWENFAELPTVLGSSRGFAFCVASVGRPLYSTMCCPGPSTPEALVLPPPQGSVQNRPCRVTSKPAIAGPEL